MREGRSSGIVEVLLNGLGLFPCLGRGIRGVRGAEDRGVSRKFPVGIGLIHCDFCC